MLKWIAHKLIAMAEKRVGVKFDYVHQIAQTDISLLLRYNKIFGFLDSNKKVPALAYHVARMRGAIAADCGTCVEAEINLAKNAKLDASIIDQILIGEYSKFSLEIAAVGHLTDAVIGQRIDEPEAREVIKTAYGEAGLIELAYAMNGSSLLPGIKRAMGYATACDIETIQKIKT